MKNRRTGDSRQRRRDRLVQEAVHDPYKLDHKPEEPAVCGECGVIFHDGRWQWSSEAPAESAVALCPACRRIQDKVPAGYLTLTGDFFRQHRREIMHLVENTIHSQQEEHPLKRVMETEETDDGVVVTFTDIHLPHTVGVAIERAYDGELDMQFAEESGISRAYWSRQ